MSKTEVKKTEKKTFAYRNIKKELNVFPSYSEFSDEFHIELGADGEMVIVEDKPTDWRELANKNADKVGLAYVLQVAARTGQMPAPFMDSEAIDVTMINPNDPDGLHQLAKEDYKAKVDELAQKLGVSVDELLKAFISGQLEELITSKTGKTEESEAQ